MNEQKNLEHIAPFYYSAEAENSVDHFHLYIRDIVIPPTGGQSALELGCGNGRWTQVLCERYVEVDTVDAAAQLIESVMSNCRETGAVLRGHVSLVENFLASSKRTWQHIYLTMLLEHVADPVEVLKLTRRACSPGGMIFIAVPNATSIHRLLAVRAGLIAVVDELSESDLKVGHRRIYTQDLISKHVQEAGYTITETIPVGLKPLTHSQMKALPDAVLWALCRSGDLVPHNSAYLIVKAKP